jgi:hypothetical protein
VIDFRYHLVSLIAVFLAVALGIVIGATALNQPILSDIHGQVGTLEQDKRTLEDRTRQLSAQVDADEAFGGAVAPALVKGALAARRVVLVVTSDRVPATTVDQMGTLVQQAGGTVAGTVRLRPGYTDPASASKIGSYVAGPGLPAGITLPQTDDSAQLVATLLADVLVVPHGQASARSGDTAAISSVLAGLSALDVLTQDSAQVTPADYAVLLTAGARTGTDAAQRNAPLVDLAAALDAAGSGAVIAGDRDSAGTGGLVAAVRGSTSVSTTVSTVDDVDTTAGRVSTVLALPRERSGTSGKYGTGKDAQPVPPVPGATP